MNWLIVAKTTVFIYKVCWQSSHWGCVLVHLWTTSATVSIMRMTQWTHCVQCHCSDSNYPDMHKGRKRRKIDPSHLNWVCLFIYLDFNFFLQGESLQLVTTLCIARVFHSNVLKPGCWSLSYIFGFDGMLQTHTTWKEYSITCMGKFVLHD